MADVAIGIDLGTTNSCVSIYIDGATKILENSDGGRITPSFVFLKGIQEIIIGEHAKNLSSSKPEYGIYEVKRLVGRNFSDSDVQKNIKYLPFKVQPDPDGKAVIIIEQQNKVVKKTPQELCTLILQKLKKDAEDKLGCGIKKVVITVPAYFNVTQREVTFAAAREAGFTVLKLLNEPTAAALSYYFQSNRSGGDHYSLVYDLGGGTFDVAVLKNNRNQINIVGVGGDPQLGGHDFDNLIVDHVCKHLIKNYRYNPKTDAVNLRRLHYKCEEAKRILSTVQETEINLVGFSKNHPLLQVKITREEFEGLAENLFNKTIRIVDICLKSCSKSFGISKNDIQEVILAGGSTRIPKVQQLLSEFFNGKSLNKTINPDECVAEGAALQAAMLSKSVKQKLTKFKLKDVVPLSLGIETMCDKMHVLIPRNSPIPASESMEYKTIYHNQPEVTFKIYEGERPDVKKNRLIGEFTMTDLTEAPPGECKIKFTMNIDENGILTVKAEERHKRIVKELTVNYTRGSQNDGEIQNNLLDAEEFKLDDVGFERFVIIKKYLLQYCIQVRYNLDKQEKKDEYEAIYQLCEKTEESVQKMGEDKKDEVIQTIKQVKGQCEPIILFLKFESMPTLKIPIS